MKITGWKIYINLIEWIKENNLEEKFVGMNDKMSQKYANMNAPTKIRRKNGKKKGG